MIRVHFLRCSFYTQKKDLGLIFSLILCLKLLSSFNHFILKTQEIKSGHGQMIRLRMNRRKLGLFCSYLLPSTNLNSSVFAHALFCFVILIMIVGGWRTVADKSCVCQQKRMLNEKFWPDIENSRGVFRTIAATDKEKTGAKMILLANQFL